mgnify:FL=1
MKCSEYLPVANELCVVGGIVMRATRIVIPKNLRATVLTIGHEGHLGVVSMKQRLRTKVWWPKLERKTATQRKRTSVGVTDQEGSLRRTTEDLRLNVAEILQSIELAPQTRRSYKEEIDCRGTQNAEKG